MDVFYIKNNSLALINKFVNYLINFVHFLLGAAIINSRLSSCATSMIMLFSASVIFFEFFFLASNKANVSVLLLSASIKLKSRSSNYL